MPRLAQFIVPNDFDVETAMFHLMYLSSAWNHLSEATLEDLLNTSRRNNRRTGVTGMLLYLDGNFVQYLEGDESDVRGVFAKIQTDPRHHSIHVLEEGPADCRLFDDWSMGFRKMDRASDDAAGLFDLTHQALTVRLPPDFPRAVRIFMEQFYRANSPGA